MFTTVLTTVLAATGMPLIKLDPDIASQRGALCLDGTAPGMYYSQNATADRTKWVLYFKGGGWCYDEDSCASRAYTELGSAAFFPETFSFGGIMDPDADANPTFHDFNRVVLWYCDGASFSGDRTEPLSWPDPKHAGSNMTLYFRGKRVLNYMMETLRSEYGLDQAKEIVVGGGSAGGLSTYLHVDYIAEEFSGAKVRGVPVSGFFLDHVNYEGEAVYPDHMKYSYDMQNASVNSACVASEELPWKCMLANFSYHHTVTPMFPLQSALDSWQMGNIWEGDKSCAKDQFANCTAPEIADLNGYLSDFMVDLRRSPKFSRAGEGGFVESCLEHVAAQSSSHFKAYTINNVTEVAALARWYASENEPAANHWYLPCTLTTDAPHQCNPTCGTTDVHFMG